MVVGGGSIDEDWKYQKQVTFTGFVPEVFTAVRNCKALVAPIRFAGGTPSKIIEAMSYGIPVITTSQGCAGIKGIDPGNNICVVSSEDAQDWVTAINRVITDDEYRVQVGRLGRVLVETFYSKNAAEVAFEERMQQIARFTNNNLQ